MFGVFFYVSVCSVEVTLAINEINFFCERQSPLNMELVLSGILGNSSPVGI